MQRRIALIAVALPVLAIVLGVVRAEMFMRHARDFVMEIGGYDPRDLLRGHYLLFRVAVDPAAVREPCDDDGAEPCCLCLTRAAGEGPVTVERATCATARRECDGALRTSLTSQPTRYYVPEEHAEEIDRRVHEATQRRAAVAVVAIDADGNGRVREIRIDGEPIPGGVTPLQGGPPGAP